MRVIAGQFRGRALASPDGRTTRPITDRVKETLFNILGARYGRPGEIPDVEVLDVFAGTGSLGIEAVSRGARAALFVERDRHALAALRENLRTLHLISTCGIVSDNAWTMRPPASHQPGGFGLIFVDPPYRETDNALRVVDLLERLAPVLAPSGLLVYRYEHGRPFEPQQLRALVLDDQRAIGRMHLAFLMARPPETANTSSPVEQGSAT